MDHGIVFQDPVKARSSQHRSVTQKTTTTVKHIIVIESITGPLINSYSQHAQGVTNTSARCETARPNYTNMPVTSLDIFFLERNLCVPFRQYLSFSCSDFDNLGLFGKLRSCSIQWYRYRQYRRYRQRPVSAYRRIGKNVVSAHP